jgi:RNA polymerase sigma-70 factor (ECF subfamily)
MKKLVYRKAYIEQLNNNRKFDFNTEEIIYFNDLAALLEKLINKLPPRRKEIFLLSRMDGLTYIEIAKKLDITENTVDTQIRKALDFLRQKLNRMI